MLSCHNTTTNRRVGVVSMQAPLWNSVRDFSPFLPRHAASTLSSAAASPLQRAISSEGSRPSPVTRLQAIKKRFIILFLKVPNHSHTVAWSAVGFPNVLCRVAQFLMKSGEKSWDVTDRNITTETPTLLQQRHSTVYVIICLFTTFMSLHGLLIKHCERKITVSRKSLQMQVSRLQHQRTARRLSMSRAAWATRSWM